MARSVKSLKGLGQSAPAPAATATKAPAAATQAPAQSQVLVDEVLPWEEPHEPVSVPPPTRTIPGHLLVPPHGEPGSIDVDEGLGGPAPSPWVRPPWADNLLMRITSTAFSGGICVGGRSSGKTSSIMQAVREARGKGFRVYYDSMQVNRMTSIEDLQGVMCIQNGQTVFVPSSFARAMKHSHLTDDIVVFVIEEGNMAQEGLFSWMHSALDGSGQPIRLPDGTDIRPKPSRFKVFVLINPSYVGTRALNQAFVDRLGVVSCPFWLDVEGESRIISERTGLSNTESTRLAEFAHHARKAGEDSGVIFDLSLRILLRMAALRVLGMSWVDVFEAEFIPYVDQPSTCELVAPMRQLMDRQAVKSWCVVATDNGQVSNS